RFSRDWSSDVCSSDLLASSYQHAYGNLYTTPTDILEPKYASAIDALSTTDANTLIAQGLLPRNALFDSKPPAPEFASMTPATKRSEERRVGKECREGW